MMRKLLTTLLTTLIFCVPFTFCAYSQVAISNISELNKIKNGTTYVAMYDPGSESAQEYVQAIEHSWTISKLKFIKYSEIERYISPESSFLTIGGYVTSVKFTNLYKNGSRNEGIDFTNTHLYLELWTCNERFFRGNRNKEVFGDRNKIQVARIELFTDFAALADPDLVFQADYDGNGHIRNWGPGILKNDIQSLMSFLNKNENRKLYSEILNKQEIKMLQNEILYVPEYVMLKFNKFTGSESKKHEESDLFGDYKFKYKLISTDALNKKILEDKTPFYYLTYIKSSTDKYVTVVNSVTGAIIYSAYSPMSYNIKSGDLKDLRRKVE